jgi:hypothetical protein
MPVVTVPAVCEQANLLVLLRKNCSLDILTTLPNSIAIEPRALWVTSTLAFLEQTVNGYQKMND